MPRIALLVVLLSAGASAGESVCTNPHPKEHYITCPKGERPVWWCNPGPFCPPGVCDPNEWRWQERCEPIPKK